MNATLPTRNQVNAPVEPGSCNDKASLPSEGMLRLAAAITQLPEEVILARLLSKSWCDSSC